MSPLEIHQDKVEKLFTKFVRPSLCKGEHSPKVKLTFNKDGNSLKGISISVGYKNRKGTEFNVSFQNQTNHYHKVIMDFTEYFCIDDDILEKELDKICFNK